MNAKPQHELVAIGETALTPLGILDRAVERGATPDTLEKLMALQERWEKNQARKAFDAALADAKAKIPIIGKNREVDFTSSKGRTNYRHEDLAEITRVVGPILAEHGLSYRFRTTSAANEPVSVTCIVSHRDGHSEENTLSAARDETGNKNSIQAIGSTVTYLQRYTLKAALGLAASDEDDGNASDAPTTITAEQVKDLQQRIMDADTDIAKFLRVYRIERLADLPVADYERAAADLDTVKAKKAAKAKQS